MRNHKLKKVLDVGCGTGKLVRFLNDAGFSATGCDLSEEALKIAKQKNKKNTFVKASAIKLPFKNNSFDLLTVISLVEHLTKKEINMFLSEAYRVVKPNGYIFLVTPNFNSPMRFLLRRKWFGYSDPTHITFFTPSSLKSHLQKYGFINTRYWFKTKNNFLTYLLFSTPLCFIRDSFWIAAKKTENIDCINCQSPKATKLFALRDSKEQNTYTFYKCNQCTLMQLHPFPNLNKKNKKFYSYKNSVEHIVMKNPQVRFVNAFLPVSYLLGAYADLCNRLRYTQILNLSRKGSILDIGCSDGNFLEKFDSHIWQCSGIELNRHLATAADMKLSHGRIITSSIETTTLPKNSFTIITLWHVLEHLEDPKKVIKKIYQLLKPNGHVVIEVPHSDSLNRTLFGVFWQLLLVPQHLHFWNKKSLNLLLQQEGFDVVKVKYHGIISFSTVSSIANVLRANGLNSTLAILLAFLSFPFGLLLNFFLYHYRENIMIIAIKR